MRAQIIDRVGMKNYKWYVVSQQSRYESDPKQVAKFTAKGDAFIYATNLQSILSDNYKITIGKK